VWFSLFATIGGIAGAGLASWKSGATCSSVRDAVASRGYLYGRHSYVERHGVMPFGELSHGTPGVGVEPSTSLGFVTLAAMKKRVANKRRCRCGSESRVGQCHHTKVIALAELEALTSSDTAAMEFRTGTQGVLATEIAPLVTTTVRWPPRQTEQSELFPTESSSSDLRELSVQLDDLRSKMAQVQKRITRVVDERESSEWKSGKGRKR
jgi:hypothetical protein